MPANSPRTCRLNHRQRKALRERRVWAIVGLLAALCAPVLWYAALNAGYLASPYHAGFEIVASLAFAVTGVAIFSVFGWIDADDRADGRY